MKKMFLREIITDSKKMMQLALPIVLSSVSIAALGITDSYFLSKLTSPIALAGAGLAGMFLVVFFATVYGFLNPLVVMIGQAAGEKNNKKVGEIIRVGFFMALLAGVGSGLLLFISYFALGMFGQPAEVIAEIFPYWLCTSLTMVFWATGTVVKQALDALQKTWTATAIYSLMLVVNLPISYSFIFGIEGWVPALGLTGAGIGWLVADMVVNIVLFCIFSYRAI